MGGYGSGRIGNKQLTTEMISLDMRMLWNSGFLRSGQRTPIILGHGVFNHTGLLRADSKLKAVHLNYTCILKNGEHRRIDMTIELEWTPCHFGGHRPWFLCPACNRRVGILYGRRLFYCRNCQQLAYPVENENSFSRLVRKAKGVRAQMRYDKNLLKPLRYSRPKGMHWNKYIALLYKALSIEEAIWSYLDGNPVSSIRA